MMTIHNSLKTHLSILLITLVGIFISGCFTAPTPKTPVWYFDGDSDNYGDVNYPLTADTQPAQYVANKLDCNDSDNGINPDISEADDGIDNNCDGTIDEGFLSCLYSDGTHIAHNSSASLDFYPTTTGLDLSCSRNKQNIELSCASGTITPASSLDNLSSNIDDCIEQTAYDIVFLIDNSSSIGSSNFALLKNYLHDLIDLHTAIDGNIKLTMIDFASTVNTATFENTTLNVGSKTQILSDIDNLTYTGGYTQTDLALEETLLYFENFGAANTVKTIFLITDGVPSGSEGDADVCYYATQIWANDIRLQILGIGSDWVDGDGSDAMDCLVVNVIDDISIINDFTSFSTMFYSRLF